MTDEHPIVTRSGTVPEPFPNGSNPDDHPIVERPPDMYLSDGSMATMKDVMRWWQYHYPTDIFIDGPLPMIHGEMDRLLKGEYHY